MKVAFNYRNPAFARTVSGIIGAGKDPNSNIRVRFNPMVNMKEQAISAFCNKYEYRHEKWASAMFKNIRKLELPDGLTIIQFKNTRGLVIKCTSPYTYQLVLIPNNPPNETLAFWTGAYWGPEIEHGFNQIRMLMSGVPSCYQDLLDHSATMMLRLTPEEVQDANRKGANCITPLDVIDGLCFSTMADGDVQTKCIIEGYKNPEDLKSYAISISRGDHNELHRLKKERESANDEVDAAEKRLTQAKQNRKNINKQSAMALLRIFNHRIWQ